jgi:hypothetical protein
MHTVTVVRRTCGLVRAHRQLEPGRYIRPRCPPQRQQLRRSIGCVKARI